MRRIVISVLVVFMAFSSNAQIADTLAVPPVDKNQFRKKPVEARSADHFLLQLGYLNWSGAPDSIKTKGMPHSFNVYLMMDFPFKTNNHWSVALGPGIASDHMYFDKMYPGIKDPTTSIRFDDQSDTTHFKKIKLATAYAELPVELRYRLNPDNNKKSFKVAIGAKVGTLLNAHVKAKDLLNSSGNSINPYTLKETSKRFFNKSRLSVMGRVGIGHFSLYASYSITPLFKEGEGPVVKPLSIGLTLSGL